MLANPQPNRDRPNSYTLGKWKDLEAKDAQSFVEQKIITTDRITVVRVVYRPGSDIPAHFHPQEQITIVEEGALQLTIEGQPVVVRAGEMIVIPPRVRHATRLHGEQPARALNLFVLPEPQLRTVGGAGSASSSR